MRRRPAEQILQEAKEEEERMRHARLPPSRKLLGEKEKDKLAFHMRYRGEKLPDAKELLEQSQPKAPPSAAPRSQVDLLLERYDELAEQVEEIQSFTKDMESKGAFKRDIKRRCDAELAEKVREMRQLQQQFAALQ